MSARGCAYMWASIIAMGQELQRLRNRLESSMITYKQKYTLISLVYVISCLTVKWKKQTDSAPSYALEGNVIFGEWCRVRLRTIL